MRQGSSGFSLIELMIVMGILIIILSLALVNTQYLNKLVAHTEIELLKSTASYLRYKAMATGQAQTLVFDIPNKSYSCEGHSYALPNSLCFGVMPRVKGPPSAPTAFLTHPITFADNTITFYPDGIISSGTVYLTDNDQTILYALSNGIATVSFLREYRYDTQWHLIE